MHKLTNFIEQKLYPLSLKFAENKYLIALSHGLMVAMPVLIFGSMCILIADFPVKPFQVFMESVFGEIWGEWAWSILVPATIGLVSLLSLIGVANSLAEQEQVDRISAIVISICAFFILLVQTDDGGFASIDFEARGLFMAMLTALITTRLYAYLIHKDVRIKLPKSVPSFVSNQFSAVVPAFIILPLFLIIRLAVGATPYGTVTNMIIELIQAPLVGIGTTLGGTLFASFLNTFLWVFGIHGTSVTGAFMDPLWYAARFENLEIFKQGINLIRPHIATMDYANFFIFLGGTGLTFPLTVLMTFKGKSERMKSLGKLSIVPGLFNVNEPVIFGLPIVLNPTMLIPFFLAPTVSILVSWFAMKTGIVPYPTGVTIPWTTPLIVGGWLMCNSWKGGALQLVVTILAGLIYWPFFRALDHQYLEEEKDTQTSDAETISNKEANTLSNNL